MKTFYRIKHFVLFLFFVISHNALFSQPLDNLPQITLKDINNIKITRNDIYDGGSLWGYINGGADVYLDYGFEKVRVQELMIEEASYKIEIYRMKSPKAAFGIFSVSHLSCRNDTSLSRFNCINPYQIQLCCASSYISITNESGTEQALSVCRKLAGLLMEKFSEKSFEIPDFFKHKLFSEEVSHLKYFSCPLGIQNGYPAWQDLFDDTEEYEIYFLPLKYKNTKNIVAKIKFATQVDRESFIEKSDAENVSQHQFASSEGSKKLYWETGATEMVFLQSKAKSINIKPLIAEISDIIATDNKQ